MRHFRLLLSVLALLLTTASHAAVGDSFTIDQLTFTVLSEKTEDHTGTASIANSDENISGYFPIPETVEYNGFIYTVTEIGNNAFGDRDQLTSVWMPNTITVIKDEAFYDCNSLKEAKLSNNLEIIGMGAFYCTALRKIIVPMTVTEIDFEAFSGCEQLEDIQLYEGLKIIRDYAFESTNINDITIPRSVEHIGDNVFQGCNNLMDLRVKHMTPLELNWDITSENLYQNIELWVPNGSAEQYAAANIWNKFKDVNNTSFYDFDYTDGTFCYYIVDEVGVWKNYGYVAVKPLYQNIEGDVTIPDSVSFNGDTYLVTEIKAQGFADCKDITSINGGKNVCYINGYAFKGCNSLLYVEISESVEDISRGVFNGCTALEKIIVKWDNPIDLSYDITDSNLYGQITLEVPYGCENNYTSADFWQDFNVVSRGFDGDPLDYTILSEEFKTVAVKAADPEITGDIVIPELVSISGSQYTVVAVENEGFNNCELISSITLPASVTSIGDNAFENCFSLSSINIGDNLKSIGAHAFENCDMLTSINIPNGLTSIGSLAFYYCSGLTSFSIPGSVSVIGDNPFYRCENLPAIDVDSNNPSFTSLDGVLFNKDLSALISYPAKKQGDSYDIPSSVVTIGNRAFGYCGQLSSITIPKGVTKIGDFAFDDCASITSITIPETVKTYGNQVFAGCKKLAELHVRDTNPSELEYPLAELKRCQDQIKLFIPENVTSDGKNIYLYSYYWNLFSAQKSWAYDPMDYDSPLAYEITNEATDGTGTVSVKAVSRYIKEKDIAIPASVEIDNVTYRVTAIKANGFIYCDSIVNVSLPSSITSIGNSAFLGCDNLTTINIPGNVKTLPYQLFCNCPALKNVIFDENSQLQSINLYVFDYCESLEELNLPNTVTYMRTALSNTGGVNGSNPFGHNTNLKNINIDSPKYKSFDGIVYSPDQTVLYFIPGGIKSCVVAEQTTVIDSCAAYATQLENIILPDNLEIIRCGAFYASKKLNNIILPKSCHKIEEGAFELCHSLSTFAVPDDSELTWIGSVAFYGCQLNSFNMPGKLEMIGPSAFGSHYINDANPEYFNQFEELNLPGSLRYVGQKAFNRCKNLKSISFPEGVEYIGNSVCASCSSLEYAYVPQSFTKFSQLKDVKTLFKKYKEDLIHHYKYYTDGYERSYRAHSLFSDCVKLEKVDWLASIDTIGNNTFKNCSSLIDFKIPDHTKVIESGAFSNCSTIRLIKIPNSVKFINNTAFEKCFSLTHITYPSWLDRTGSQLMLNDNEIWEYTIPAYVTKTAPENLVVSATTDGNWQNIKNFFIMGNAIPDTLKYTLASKTPVFYVKKSVYDQTYPDGKFEGMNIDYYYKQKWIKDTTLVTHKVDYKIPLSMTNAAGNPIEYKTLCRDFDVDFTHTNDNLPEGVEPLRAYVVEDVDGDLRMVFLNEMKYIPSRLKANVKDENGNLYQGVDEYVGVLLRGTPGYTYYYEMGEHDYTQGAEGQWLLDDAMEYSGKTFEKNLMAGDANDDFYVFKTVEDDNSNEIVNYGLNNGRFKIYHKDGWLTYNKSYLQLPKDVSAAIEGDTDAEGNANLTFVFDNADGSTNKVSSVEVLKNAESDIFYNTMGQRVKPNAKGVVINNGKKYVNK